MACSQITYDEKLNSLYKNTVPLIKSDELTSISNEDDIYLLDIRSKAEYKVSHLPGASFIDYEDFQADDVKEIPKDAKVVLYCSVGYRSERIGEKLIKMGYSDVSNLYGGIFQWKNEGREVINCMQTPTDSVHTYNRKWSKWLEKGIKVY
jgi:rhodanese-related sulfurtransferase